MKQRISMVINQEIVRLAKKRAADEQRTLSGLIQEVLVRQLRQEAATPSERKMAYQLFCERPMKYLQSSCSMSSKKKCWINDPREFIQRMRNFCGDARALVIFDCRGDEPGNSR